jgi:transcription termination/antitermination protein NusG
MNDDEEKRENEEGATAELPPADVPVIPTEIPDEASSTTSPEAIVPVAAPAEPKPLDAAPVGGKRWYVVKVQSGREESIKNALERRVKIDSLEEHVGRILIPTEKVTELRNGKRVIKKRKKFPGYLMCEVEFNDKILYLFRETSGVGDFVGGSLHKPPAPMNDREVERMLLDEDDGTKPKGPEGEKTGTKPRVIIPYAVNDRVKVRDGTFKDMEGEVKEITEPTDPKENPKVKVVLTIWGRPVDVEVEYWQVDPV